MKPACSEGQCLLSATTDVPKDGMGPRRARGDRLRTGYMVKNCAHWALQYAQHAEHQFGLADHLCISAEDESLSRALAR